MTIGTTTDNATGESASSGSGGQDPQGSGVRFVLAHVDTLHDNVPGAASMRRDMIEELEAEPALWWLDYLAGQGYQLAEVETQARASFDEVITECLGRRVRQRPRPRGRPPRPERHRPW